MRTAFVSLLALASCTAPAPLTLHCPPTVSVGPIVAGQRSQATLSCPVEGDAKGELSITQTGVDGPFSVLGGSTSAAAKGRVALEIAFDPPLDGSHHGTLKLD